MPSGFQASGKTAKAFVQVTHSANDDKPCLWMAVPEGVKGTDQAFLTFLRGVSSDVDKFRTGAVQDFLEFPKRDIGLGFRVKGQWKFCSGTDIFDIHVVGDHLYIVCASTDALYGRTDILADRNNMVICCISMTKKWQAWISLGLDLTFHVVMHPDRSGAGACSKSAIM